MTALRCSGVSISSRSASLSASFPAARPGSFSLTTLRTAARCSGVSVASRSASPARKSPDTMPDPGDLSRKSPILSDSRSESPSRTSTASRSLMAALTASRCSGVSISSRSARRSASFSRSSSGSLSLTMLRTAARCSGVSMTVPPSPGCDCADAAAIPSVRTVAASPNFFIIVPSSILPNADHISPMMLPAAPTSLDLWCANSATCCCGPITFSGYDFNVEVKGERGGCQPNRERDAEPVNSQPLDVSHTSARGPSRNVDLTPAERCASLAIGNRKAIRTTTQLNCHQY